MSGGRTTAHLQDVGPEVEAPDAHAAIAAGGHAQAAGQGQGGGAPPVALWVDGLHHVLPAADLVHRT